MQNEHDQGVERQNAFIHKSLSKQYVRLKWIKLFVSAIELPHFRMFIVTHNCT